MQPNNIYVTFPEWNSVPTQRTRTTLVVRVRPTCEQVTTVKYSNEGNILKRLLFKTDVRVTNLPLAIRCFYV